MTNDKKREKRMSEERKNSDLGIDRKDEPNTATGLKSMGDILALPDRERRIINWLIRHKQSTLPEVAEHFGEDELTIKTELEELVKQGYIQKSELTEELRYSVKLAAKRGSDLF